MKIDGIADELNETPLVKEAPDLSTLIKTALSAQAMIGNSIRIPSDNAPDSDKQEFRAKLERVGMVPKDKFTDFVRPEKPEMYALTQPPTGAEAVITQMEIDALKKHAHDMGLAPKQFEELATREITTRLERAKVQQERFGAVDTEVKAKYGEAGLTSAKERALAAAKRFGGDLLVKQLNDAPDAATIIAFAEIGKLFQERGMGDLTPMPKFMETREEAATKLDEIARNKEHPFNRGRMAAGQAAYEAAAREVIRLRSLAMGVPPPKGDYLFEESA